MKNFNFEHEFETLGGISGTCVVNVVKMPKEGIFVVIGDNSMYELVSQSIHKIATGILHRFDLDPNTTRYGQRKGNKINQVNLTWKPSINQYAAPTWSTMEPELKAYLLKVIGNHTVNSDSSKVLY